MDWKATVNKNLLMIAMVVGIIGYPVFRHLMPLLPPLIFLMLFFAFLRIKPRTLRFHRWHWAVLGTQIPLAIGSYYLIMALPPVVESQEILAQGVMLCFLMPTATAAPIIANKLGGNLESLTSFTLLTNILTAIIVPLFFPVIHPMPGLTFWSASWTLLCRVGPLLLGPFICSWIVQLILKDERMERINSKCKDVPFFLWSGTIIILTGDVTHTLVHGTYPVSTLVIMAAAALVVCLIQFFFGKWLGYRLYNKDHSMRIAAGQAFGQKNTSLGVWMAETYLLPYSCLGAAAYIVWQNIFNSEQLRRQKTAE
ncbi:MAG: transporter [Paludibacteraceae bacterium]|nr:transporter [Paludibacteraceae bacterium]MBQ4391451.1 transporter [Paludibacteraceae bacterium]